MGLAFGTQIATDTSSMVRFSGGKHMVGEFVRRHTAGILIGLAALVLMALPMQEAKADNFNLGNFGNYTSGFSSGPGNTFNLLNLLSLSGGLSDIQIFNSLNNSGNNFSGSAYLTAWQGILQGSDGYLPLGDANLFAQLFGGSSQDWENFFNSWWHKKHSSVPEPGTLGLLSCGLVGVLLAGGLLKRRNPIS